MIYRRHCYLALAFLFTANLIGCARQTYDYTVLLGSGFRADDVLVDWGLGSVLCEDVYSDPTIGFAKSIQIENSESWQLTVMVKAIDAEVRQAIKREEGGIVYVNFIREEGIIVIRQTDSKLILR